MELQNNKPGYRRIGTESGEELGALGCRCGGSALVVSRVQISNTRPAHVLLTGPAFSRLLTLLCA
jgi:hypothetical protein